MKINKAGLKESLFLGLMLLGGVLLRLIYLWEMENKNPFFYDIFMDAAAYDNLARSISSGSWLGREVFYQSPMYPYFLATLYSIFGHNLFLPRLIQILARSSRPAITSATPGGMLTPSKTNTFISWLLSIISNRFFNELRHPFKGILSLIWSHGG